MSYYNSSIVIECPVCGQMTEVTDKGECHLATNGSGEWRHSGVVESDCGCIRETYSNERYRQDIYSIVKKVRVLLPWSKYNTLQLATVIINPNETEVAKMQEGDEIVLVEKMQEAKKIAEAFENLCWFSQQLNKYENHEVYARLIKSAWETIESI